MNIAIISTHDQRGGAARAAWRLYNALNQQENTTATMLVKNKTSNRNDVFEIKSNDNFCKEETEILDRIQYDYINKKLIEKNYSLFSAPYSGYNLANHQAIQNADIINIHWTVSLLSTQGIKHLLELGKPVIFTLHDLGTFTGGCHYSSGCKGYEKECLNCPILCNDKHSIPYKILKEKLETLSVYENFAAISPSSWLAEEARKSRFFQNKKVKAIANSVETEIFKPIDKSLAKKELGISADTFTLLFGVVTAKETRKGFDLLKEAIEYCKKNEFFADKLKKGKIKILAFGEKFPALEEMQIPIKALGEINNDKKLSLIYSAADIYILPSREDNLPNTLVESFSCGTPALGFDIGGIPELIENNKTGFLAPNFDTNELANNICYLLENDIERKKTEKKCREKAEKEYSQNIQAQNYIDFFNELLSDFTIKKKEINSNENKIKYLPFYNEKLFSLYREFACKTIQEKDNLTKEIYQTKSYKIGNLLLSPLSLLKRKTKN